MCEVGEEYKLCPLTIHNAVRYLDRVLGVTDVAKNKLQLVAMACVLVASKCEEAEDVTPTLAELNECSNHAYTSDMVKETEIAVLRALNWSLTTVNPIHFLQFFQARGIVFQNDLFEGGAQNRRSALKYVKKYADFFAELCLQEYGFQRYIPSVMAAAVVAAARRAVKIDPIWNSELEGLTTYDESSIYSAYDSLWKYYVISFPTAPQCLPSPTSVVQFEERALKQQQVQLQKPFQQGTPEEQSAY
jgi:cyclin A